MKKLLLALSMLQVCPLFAESPELGDPTLVTTVKDTESFTPFESHWVASFGFETIGYELPYSFEGDRKSFDDETRQLYGGRLGLGREFYLGKRINMTTKVEGFYMGTLFERATNATPGAQGEIFSSTKRTGHVWGGELTQSLGLVFEMVTKNPFMDEMTYLTIEPYIEVGIGGARAYNRIGYYFDTGASNVQEKYQHRIEDELVTQKIGLGVNFTSRDGYFLYLKASQYRLDVTKRDETGFSQPNNVGSTRIDRSSKDVDMDPVTVYALGGGYKF